MMRSGFLFLLPVFVCSASIGPTELIRRKPAWSHASLAWFCNLHSASYGLCSPELVLNQTELNLLHRFLIEEQLDERCGCRFFFVIVEGIKAEENSTDDFAEQLRLSWAPNNCDSIIVLYVTQTERFGISYCFPENTTSLPSDFEQTARLKSADKFRDGDYYSGIIDLLQVLQSAKAIKTISRVNRDHQEEMDGGVLMELQEEMATSQDPQLNNYATSGVFVTSAELILGMVSAVLLTTVVLLVWFFCCSGQRRAASINRRLLVGSNLIKTRTAISIPDEEEQELNSHSPPIAI